MGRRATRVRPLLRSYTHVLDHLSDVLMTVELDIPSGTSNAYHLCVHYLVGLGILENLEHRSGRLSWTPLLVFFLVTSSREPLLRLVPRKQMVLLTVLGFLLPTLTTWHQRLRYRAFGLLASARHHPSVSLFAARNQIVSRTRGAGPRKVDMQRDVTCEMIRYGD